MLDAEEMLPVVILFFVKGTKLCWEMIIFLKDYSNRMLKVEKVLPGSSLEGQVVAIDPEVHKLYLTIKSDSYVV